MSKKIRTESYSIKRILHLLRLEVIIGLPEDPQIQETEEPLSHLSFNSHVLGDEFLHRLGLKSLPLIWFSLPKE
jgi:hypothetical protein